MARERTVRVTLTGDAKSMRTAFASAGKAGQDFKKVLGAVVGAAGIGALIAGFKRAASASIDLARDFEYSMAKIVGLVGIAADEVAGMEDAVLRLSGETAKAPQELADALFFVTSAGLRGETALQVLEESARAAAAGLGETKDVALAVTGTINAYGRENLSAAEATDILVNTIRLGNVEASAIAPVLGRIVPIASQVGVSFDQVGAAIAAITRLGGNATETVTSLRGIFRAIIKPSKEAQDVFEQYGTSAAGIRKELREEGLLATLQTLNDIFGENEEALTKVFGRIQGLVGFLGLMGGNVEDNIEIFDEMSDSTGVLDEAFEAMANTSTFKLEQALVDVKTIATEVGLQVLPQLVEIVEKLLPAVEPVVMVMGDFVSGLALVAEWIIGLPGPIKNVAAAVGGLATAFGLISTGHPVILALTLVAGGIALIGKNAREHQADVDAMVQALRDLDEASRKTIDTMVIQAVIDADLDDARKAAGIGIKEFTDAVLGNEEAVASVNEKMAALTASTSENNTVIHQNEIDMMQLNNVLQEQTGLREDAAGVIEEQDAATKALAAEELAEAQAAGRAEEFQDKLMQQHARTTPVVEEATAAVDEQVEKLRDLEDEASSLTEELYDAIAAQENLAGVMKSAADPIFNLIDELGNYDKTLKDIEDSNDSAEQKTIDLAKANLDLAEAWDGMEASGYTVEESISAIGAAAGLTDDEVITLLGSFGIFVDEADGIGQGISDGVVGGLDDLSGDFASTLIDEVMQGMSQAKYDLGIRSPSTVFADELGYPIAEGVAQGILDGEDEAVSALEELTENLREEAEQGLDDIFSAIKSELSFRDAGDNLADAEEELADIREENRTLPEQIQAAEDALARARAEAAQVTLEEQLAIERATDALTEAEEEYANGEITITEYLLAQQRLQEAYDESVGDTRAVEDAEEALAELRERENEIAEELEDAERAVLDAKLDLIEAERDLIEAGDAVIGVSDESRAAFTRLAEEAGFTASDVALITTAFLDAKAAAESFNDVVIAGPGAPGDGGGGGGGGGAASTYTVVAGDWMAKIADNFGVTLAALIAANPQVSNPSLIYPGQVLNIPALARGGIATQTTLAALAEGGSPEAVIPLDSRGIGILVDVMTQALRQVFLETNFGTGGGATQVQPIVVQLEIDGYMFAEKTIDHFVTALRRRDSSLQ